MVDLKKPLKGTDKMNLITKKSVQQAHCKDTRRICFATTHAKEPKRSDHPDYVGTFNVPFDCGFSRLFPYELFPNKKDRYHSDSFWRSITTEEEFQEIDTWVKEQGSRVFLRDCLYTSIAMHHNFTNLDEGARTEIGELEYRAKQNHDMIAVRKLAEHCINTITEIRLYKDADLVCAIPPQRGKDFDLPSGVVSIVSKKLDKEDITARFSFGAEKRSVKSATRDEKWEAWHNARIVFNSDLTDKKIILIDDKYQSGTTIQYIAMKLQEAGARHVLGLSMVKTMRDTDNR